jgi:hypothetical protein
LKRPSAQLPAVRALLFSDFRDGKAGPKALPISNARRVAPEHHAGLLCLSLLYSNEVRGQREVGWADRRWVATSGFASLAAAAATGAGVGMLLLRRTTTSAVWKAATSVAGKRMIEIAGVGGECGMREKAVGPSN